MKRSSPLWGSVSVLIGVVIAILALVRGAWLVPLLLLTFAAWGLWVVMFQLQPAWDSIRGYRSVRSQQIDTGRWTSAAKAAANGKKRTADPRTLRRKIGCFRK